MFVLSQFSGGSQKNAYIRLMIFSTPWGLTVPLLNDPSMPPWGPGGSGCSQELSWRGAGLYAQYGREMGNWRFFLGRFYILWIYITQLKKSGLRKVGERGRMKKRRVYIWYACYDMDMIRSLTTKALIRKWIWTHPHALCLECHWSLEELLFKTSDICWCCQSAFLFSTSTQVESIQTDS